MSWVQRFKDAALTALVALALAFPLIGFQTTETGAEFTTRFSWVAIATAATFVGRFLLSLVPQRFHLHQYGARYTALPEG